MIWPPVLTGILFRYDGMTAVKLCDDCSCRQRSSVLIRPRSSPGSTAATLADISEAYGRPGINLGEALIRAWALIRGNTAYCLW